jgi:hypothetical protein
VCVCTCVCVWACMYVCMYVYPFHNARIKYACSCSLNPPKKGAVCTPTWCCRVMVCVCIYVCTYLRLCTCICKFVYASHWICVMLMYKYPAPLLDTALPHRRGGRKDCTPGVVVVLQWCYSGVTVVLQWCHSGVTVVLPLVLRWCYSGRKVVLPWCYSGVTVVLPWADYA